MGQIIGGRWEILDKLGEGGQAETFVVRDKSANSDTRFVLKRLKNVTRLPRFGQEIAAIRSLNNPHVLRLVDADTTSARPYLVSEYCQRGSLEENKNSILRSTSDERLALFDEICAGVGAAHDANIVHRDIKPANIFLRDDNSAVVGDFGLCFMDTDERLTNSTEAVGARYYMAPELADGRLDDVTPRADVYSLGKVLYWLFTGRVFDREKHRHENHSLHRHFEFDDGVEHIAGLLDTMIVEDPRARLENAKEVRKHVLHLKRLLRGGYPPLTLPPKLCRYCGDGTYQALSTDSATVHNFGLSPAGVAELHIFICENCGHVLLFRPDRSDNKNWLRRPR